MVSRSNAENTDLNSWRRSHYCMRVHINSHFAFDFAFALPPSFTPCQPCPSPATQSTLSRRLCTVPTPSSVKQDSTEHARHHPQSSRQHHRHLAASSSRSPRGVACVCVSTGRVITRLYPCSASADPSRVWSSFPSPKVSSLSPSACVSRLSVRSSLESQFEI